MDNIDIDLKVYRWKVIQTSSYHLIAFDSSYHNQQQRVLRTQVIRPRKLNHNLKVWMVYAD